MIVPVVAGCGQNSGPLAPDISCAGIPSSCCVSVHVGPGPSLQAHVFRFADGGSSTGEQLQAFNLPSAWSAGLLEIIAVESVHDQDSLFRTWVCAVSLIGADLHIWTGFLDHASTGVVLTEVKTFELSVDSCFSPVPTEIAGGCLRQYVQGCILDGPTIFISAGNQLYCLDVSSGRIEFVSPPERILSSRDFLLCGLRSGVAMRRNRVGVVVRSVPATEGDSGGLRSSARVAYQFVWLLNSEAAASEVVGPLRVFLQPGTGLPGAAPPIVENEAPHCSAVDSNCGVMVLAWKSGRVSWIDLSSGDCTRPCVQMPCPVASIEKIALVPDHRRVLLFLVSESPVPTAENNEPHKVQVWGLEMLEVLGHCRIERLFGDQESFSCFSQGDVVVDRVSDGLFGADFIPCEVGESRSTGLVAFTFAKDQASGCNNFSEVRDHQWPFSSSSSTRDRELAAVHKRLEARLRVGLDALVEANVILDEKRNLVRHARSVLAQLAGNSLPPSPALIFKTRLDSLSNILIDEGMGARDVLREKGPTSAGLEEGGEGGIARSAVSRAGDELVRLIRAEHFVDDKGKFLYVAADVTVVGCAESKRPVPEAVDNASVATVLPNAWLEVQAGDVLHASWEAIAVTVGKEDKRQCLLARVSVDELVSFGILGVTDMQAEIRVARSDSRAQVLGSFVIVPGVLLKSLGRSSSQSIPKWCSKPLELFSMRADVVVRGSGTSNLRSLASKLRSRGQYFSNYRFAEGVARLSISAPDELTFAMLAAECRSSVSENVDISLAALSSPNVAALKRASDSIASEMESTRNVAKSTNRASCGELAALFRSQADTDEAVGCLEETFISFAQE